MADTRGVIFDVDGTLLDTNYLHTVAWWQAFRDGGHDVPMHAIHRSVGMGGDQLVKHLLGYEDERAREAHGHRYAPFLEELKAFPKAPELLRATKERGLRVVLATSSKESNLKAMLRALDADDFIDEVTSAGDVEATKPAPDIVQVALEKGGLDAHDAVLVGDTVWDVEAAARAGVASVSVLTGGISRAELQAAGAIAIYESPEQLLKEIDASPISALAQGNR